MAKKKKRGKNKRKRPQHKSTAPMKLPPEMSWMDNNDGLHALLPGEAPSAEAMTALRDNFRKELRKSPLWDEMVEKFGATEAEKLLEQVKVALKR